MAPARPHAMTPPTPRAACPPGRRGRSFPSALGLLLWALLAPALAPASGPAPLPAAASGEERRAEVLAELAAHLSSRRAWLMRDVLLALRDQGLELRDVYSGAPERVRLGALPHRLHLQARGEAWDTFDAAFDPFVVVLPGSLDAPRPDRLAYSGGRPVRLEDADLELVPAIYLELVPAADVLRPLPVPTHDLLQPLQLGQLRHDRPSRP